MIVVTGPGRSGTSVLAQLYQELGFDPGGGWISSVNAGLEHGEFWRLNNKLALALGMTMLKPPTSGPPEVERPAPPAATGYRRVAAGVKRRAITALSEPSAPPAPSPKPARNANGRVRMINWKRIPKVVDRYGEQMVQLARDTPFVKDPRFIWTLPLWIAAGAEIEHVTITTRAMDEMVASRHAAGQTTFNAVELRNALTYGLGVVSSAVYESDLSHSFIRFPGFLHDLEGLYEALRFPEPVAFEKFRVTAEQLFDPDQVHWAGSTPVA